MKILITGTIGCGKTSVISALEKDGHVVIHEQARQLIKEEQEKNSELLPWKNPEKFQLTLLNRHIQSEAMMHNSDKVIFLDTGFLDSLTFLRADGFSHTPQEYIQAAQILEYDKIFILEQLPQYTNDSQRPQTAAYAQKVHDMKEQVWEKEFGYDLIRVPVMSIDERKDFILQHISKIEGPIVQR